MGTRPRLPTGQDTMLDSAAVPTKGMAGRRRGSPAFLVLSRLVLWLAICLAAERRFARADEVRIEDAPKVLE